MVTHPALLKTVVAAAKLVPFVRHVIVNGKPHVKGVLSLQDLLEDDGSAFPTDVQVGDVTGRRIVLLSM